MSNKPVAILDEKTTIKYGDVFPSRIHKSQVVVLREDGTSAFANTWNSDPFPKQLNYRKDGNFPMLQKPGLFSRGKQYNVKIFHFSEEVEPWKCEYINAVSRANEKILYCVTFEDLVCSADFIASNPKLVEKTFKELKIDLKPGAVLFTEDDLRGLFKAFAEYTLGDMVGMVPQSELAKEKPLIFDKSKRSTGGLTYPTKFRLEFVKRMILRFREIGIYLNFEGDGYAYGRREDLE